MKILKKLMILFILAVVVAGGYIGYRYNNNLKAVSNSEKEIKFTVSSGETVGQVITDLKKEGLIKDELATKIYVRLHSVNNLQVNVYELSPSLSLEEIFNILQTGDFNYLVQEEMVIVDGTTIEQIAEVLAEHLDMTTDEILAQYRDPAFVSQFVDEYGMLDDSIFKDGIEYPLEGYLYPETYNLTNVEKTLVSYTKLMLDMMQSITDQYGSQIIAKGMNVHDFLALCSVVQSESLYDEDKPIIAGVFYNRLKLGMNLDSDVTVLYALKEKRVDLKYDDLKVDSPYNTYLYPGVPVGPICNVSLSTIEACLNPTESDYLYFFACEDGTVLYSTTYEEHLQKAAENQWY